MAGLDCQEMPTTPRPVLATSPRTPAEEGVAGEVAEEAGVLPEGEAGEDEFVEVGENVGEGLGLVGRRGGQAGGDVAGLVGAHDGTGGEGCVIVGEPVDELVTVFAELFGGHEDPWEVRAKGAGYAVRLRAATLCGRGGT